MPRKYVKRNIINYLDNNNYCRLCLKRDLILINIFERGNSIGKYIENMYYIKIKQNDRFSKYICQECIDVCIDVVKRRFRYNNNNCLLKKIQNSCTPPVEESKRVNEKPGIIGSVPPQEESGRKVYKKKSLIKKPRIKNTSNEDASKKCHPSIANIFSKYKNIVIPKECWGYDFNPYVKCELLEGTSQLRDKKKIKTEIKRIKSEEIFDDYILDYESRISPVKFQSLDIASCVKMYRRIYKKPDRYGCSIIYANNDVDHLDLFLQKENASNNQNLRRSRDINREPNETKYKRVRSKSESHVARAKLNDHEKDIIYDNFLTCSEDKWNSFFDQYIKNKNQRLKAIKSTNNERDTESQPGSKSFDKLRKRRKSINGRINYKSQETQNKTKIKKSETVEKEFKKNLIHKKKTVDEDKEWNIKQMYTNTKRKKTINNTVKVNKKLKVDLTETNLKDKLEINDTINVDALQDRLVTQSKSDVVEEIKDEPTNNELLEEMPQTDLLLEQTTKRIFICSFCDKIFSNEKVLKLHEAAHDKIFFPSSQFNYYLKF